MYSLPSDFPHEPPENYSYEVIPFRRNVLGIWSRNHAKFAYNSGNPTKCIWGFYNVNKRKYFAPVNSKKVGKEVDVNKTTPYTAMPLLKQSLDSSETVTLAAQQGENPLMITTVQTKDMTTTPQRQEFSDFCAQRDAQNTIQLNVTKYCHMVCDALLKNFLEESIKRHKFLMPSAENVEYHEACIQDLMNGKCGYEFYIESGRKYHKIMMNAHGSRSVHAFVDKKTGEMYKAASIKQPAKGVRFNLNVITEREFVLEHCDWAGGYLYRNAAYTG